jgi:cobalt/nickel transport system ATP-binding protein
MTVPAIDIRSLSFAYPAGEPVLREVSLRVEAGERVAILGPNGAGKSTLALHLNGIHLPDSGTVTIEDTLVDRSSVHEIRRRVGVVFQDSDDQLFMPTVWDDIAFGPANYGEAPDEIASRVEAALATVGMSEHAGAIPQRLSHGQRRKIALATVLVMRPSILVLDEPSSTLDPMSRREFGERILELGMTVIMVTHDLLYALELCPRSVILSGGRIVADGPTAELISDRELLAAHRLELPFGIDPALLR